MIQNVDPGTIGTTLGESDLVPVTSSPTYVNPGGKHGSLKPPQRDTAESGLVFWRQLF